VASAAAQIKAGQLRPLAVMGKTRSTMLPDVPTAAEAGYPHIEGDGWVGVLVPAGTPNEIISSLHREMVRIIALPDVKERLPTLGFEPIGKHARGIQRTDQVGNRQMGKDRSRRERQDAMRPRAVAPVGVDAHLTKRVRNVVSVTHQPADWLGVVQSSKFELVINATWVDVAVRLQ
jgi:hypothetical protein